MKIDIISRTFFEERIGSEDIACLLQEHKVISIQSSSGWDSEPPFCNDLRNSANLLCVVFDDYYGIPQTPEERAKICMFTPEQADLIMRFVDDGVTPLIIQCTAGISRSGAIGVVLNRYFNRMIADNEEDYRYFYTRNPQISPNPNVERVFSDFLELSHKVPSRKENNEDFKQ